MAATLIQTKTQSALLPRSAGNYPSERGTNYPSERVCCIFVSYITINKETIAFFFRKLHKDHHEHILQVMETEANNLTRE